MLDITAGALDVGGRALALPIRADKIRVDKTRVDKTRADKTRAGKAGAKDRVDRVGAGSGGDAGFGPELAGLPESLTEELATFLADLEGAGRPGVVHTLPRRPGRDPGHVLLVGVGSGDQAGWRAAGAGLARAASTHYPALAMRLLHDPADGTDTAVRDLAEGFWLASYRYRLAPDPPDRVVMLRRLTIATDDIEGGTAWLAEARAVADAVVLARDLTNAPSLQKSPEWLADRIVHAAARRKGVTVTVREEDELAAEGFAGIMAVGSGSVRPPRLVEMSWRPRRPRAHVLLVGKGITFDSGGYTIKPVDGMRLMRKDMGGAAAVCAALLGAADLGLPVRITAVAPLAENMISGSAMRPGDVIRHYGGLTSELRNSDAEGRVVLADAMAYATRRFKPDLMVDLATLTGAASVALGKRTAALFSTDDALAEALTAAGAEVGEKMWRLPLADEYASGLSSPVADLVNDPPGPGAVVAALYLREFTGNVRQRWAHLDMSPTSWIDHHEGDLVKGATGWGVRTLLRWLATF